MQTLKVELIRREGDPSVRGRMTLQKATVVASRMAMCRPEIEAQPGTTSLRALSHVIVQLRGKNRRNVRGREVEASI